MEIGMSCFKGFNQVKATPLPICREVRSQTLIWAFNGVFHLVDSWIEHDGSRNTFKFQLHAIDDDAAGESQTNPQLNHRRIIPTAVKLEVWKRDGGKCTKCGASDELHFDHVIPYSRGGTSLTAENIQLLCARHNLQKHDNIE